MSNATISFFCPACAIKLTVPASLAGVVGPCPSCRNQIQAPIPASPSPAQTALPAVAGDPSMAPPISQLPQSAQAPLQTGLPPAGMPSLGGLPPVYPSPGVLPQTPPPQNYPGYQEHPTTAYQSPAQAYPAPHGSPAESHAAGETRYGHPASTPGTQPAPISTAPVAELPTYLSPPPIQPVPTASTSAPVSQSPEIDPSATGHPPVLKPEPRQLPNRSHTEVVAKQMPEPAPADARRKPHPPVPRHPHRNSLFKRAIMLVLFLVMAGALFVGVVKFLKVDRNNPSPAEPPKDTPSTQPADPSGSSPAPQQETGSKSGAPSGSAKTADEPAAKSNVPAALPTPASQQPTLIEPAPELPAGIEAKSPGMEALEVLEKFLTASSLAERLPLMETKTPEAELAASILSKPLPPAPKMLLEYQESNSVEGVVDFYYNVDFETDNGPNLQTILVRTRGGGDPKVVADPFLDLFGGRLAAYAAKPTDKAGEFQVIVSAVASCMDPKIPDREKKLTLKLLPRDNTKEIALAYFGKMSKIHEMLEDGTYSLSYGKAKSCTVMLRWNTEDNAEYPYLEAIALKALDWNP